MNNVFVTLPKDGLTGQLLTYTTRPTWINTSEIFQEVDLSNYVTHTYLNSYTYIKDDSITIGENTIEPLVVDDEAEEGQVLTYANAGLIWTNLSYLSKEDAETTYAKKSYVIEKVDELKRAILGDDLEETFNTLKEVQDWVDTHGTEFSDLAKNLKDNYVTYSYINNYAKIDNSTINIGESSINVVSATDLESTYAKKSYVTSEINSLKSEILGSDSEDIFKSFNEVQTWVNNFKVNFEEITEKLNTVYEWYNSFPVDECLYAVKNRLPEIIAERDEAVFTVYDFSGI